MSVVLPAAPAPPATVRIAVLIPCFNEETTVAQVVRGFRSVLPQADIFVFDNNSKDETAQRAREAGATVRFEPRQGKGFAVLRMFQDIDADVYLHAGAGVEVGAYALICRLLRRRFLFFIASSADLWEPYGRIDGPLKWLFPLGIRLAHAIVCRTAEQQHHHDAGPLSFARYRPHLGSHRVRAACCPSWRVSRSCFWPQRPGTWPCGVPPGPRLPSLPFKG